MGDRPRVLFIVEQCNPEFASVPSEGYRLYKALRAVAGVDLVTHERNRAALRRAGDDGPVAFIEESSLVKHWARTAERLSEFRGRINWPVRHALTYPVYAQFNSRVFDRFRGAVERGVYDVVHAFTPVLPRYPVRTIEACGNTPFVLGPVNGGLAFPDGFADIARREFDRYSFLRSCARLLPGYRQTYRRASRILAGSTATLGMLRKAWPGVGDRIQLVHENGVSAEFFAAPRERRIGDTLRLIFVGRLVAYKCADVVIEAVSLLPEAIRKLVSLTVVGDGPERGNLERQAGGLGLAAQVRFTGWVAQERTAEFYREADVFCFPSIREFGGAVVLEAMAAGLPCIVADYGGIAEYVTGATGFRIPLRSRRDLVHRMAGHIRELAEDRELLSRMSAAAVERAREFTWENKARRILSIYSALLDRSRRAASGGEAEAREIEEKISGG